MYSDFRGKGLQLLNSEKSGFVSKLQQRNAAVWDKGSRKAEINIAFKKEIKEITLGSEIIPDINPKVNYLVVKCASHLRFIHAL
jgi:hypothetical protein